MCNDCTESRLVKTAVRHVPSGTIGIDRGSHWDATEDLLKKGVLPGVESLDELDNLTQTEADRFYRTLEDGYMMDDGRFVTRDEGEAIARAQEQVAPGLPEINASDIDYRGESIFDDNDDENDKGIHKEVGDTGSWFELKPFGSAYNDYVYSVFVNGEFIGSLIKKYIGPPDEFRWHVTWSARRKMETYVPIIGPEEGAEKLWLDYNGTEELPQVKAPHEQTPPIEGDPRHYEDVQFKAARLVSFLAEDEESAPSIPDPVRQLQEAGFKIMSLDGNKVKIAWPTEDNTSYRNGIRRIREILQPCLFTGSSRKNLVTELTVLFK